MGLAQDMSARGLGGGLRTTRYALVIDDLKVKYIGVEEQGGVVTSSGAEAVLAALYMSFS